MTAKESKRQKQTNFLADGNIYYHPFLELGYRARISMHFCHQSAQLPKGSTLLAAENDSTFAARGSSANFKMAFSAMSASESFSTRFPLKLWRLLNRCNSGAIYWAEQGRSVRIDRRRFEREYLMPADSAFKTSNFSSFVRQLNLYGFRKVINTFRFNQPDTFPDADIHEYHHPFFRRGHPDLLNRVQRRMKGRKNIAGRVDCGAENSPLVSSLLKPIGHSTPKEHGERPPLHMLEMNASVLRYPALPMENAASWPGCQTIPKPVTPAFLSAIPGGSNNRSAGIELAHFAPNASNPSHIAPNNYRLQDGPGHPIVEAIQQVLGDKTLSDLAMPTTAGQETPALYNSQAGPILPVYNALRAPQKTDTIPLNLPASQIRPITTESLLAHAYGVDSPHSMKATTTLPANVTTAHHSLSPLAARGELAPLSQLSSLPDTVMSHLVNLCPPINSQGHPNATNMVQRAFHSAPANTMPNQQVNFGVTMPSLVPTERFLHTAHSNSLSNLQASSAGVAPGQTPTRSYHLAAKSIPSSSQSATPPFVQQQKPFSSRSIHTMSNPPAYSSIRMSGQIQNTDSFSTSSTSMSNVLSGRSSASFFTENTGSVAALASYADTNQQVPDSSQSPEIQAHRMENLGQAGFEVKMEQVRESHVARLSVESRNSNPAIMDNPELPSASCSGGTIQHMPSSDHAQSRMSSHSEFSTASTDKHVNMIDQNASRFLRSLSQGGLESGGNSDDTETHSPLKQFQQDDQNSVESQDYFMSTIKMEMT